jgi:hypothetical protein
MTNLAFRTVPALLTLAALSTACVDLDNVPTACSSDPSTCEGADSSAGDASAGDTGVDSTTDARPDGGDGDTAVESGPDTADASLVDSQDAAESTADVADSSETFDTADVSVTLDTPDTSDAAVAVDTSDALDPCGDGAVCVAGTSAVVSGTCSGLGEEMRRTCTSACVWAAPACELKKGWRAIPAAPTAIPGRHGHTAIWTGSEMIVFGGDTGPSYTASGGRYNPSTNAWSSIASPPGAPPVARDEHTAVWTGSRMIVWGGTTATTALATGASYDPAADSWSPIAASPLSPRYQHLAAWSAATNEMVVWGGYCGGCNDGAIYTPSTDSWRMLPALPDARLGAQAALVGTELMVWGGDIGGTTQRDGFRLVLGGAAWTTIPALPAPLPSRWDADLLFDGAGLFMFGGSTSSGTTATGARYRSGATWSAISPLDTSVMTPPFRIGAAVWLGGGHVWSWSGRDPSSTTVLSGGAAYDLAGDIWAAIPGAAAEPIARQEATVVWTGKMALIWGGTTTTIGPLNDGGIFVP